jgi:A/G-specific adenine glycosylase
MLQQTTVAAVTGYFHRFTARWPTVRALAAAPDAQVMGEWAGLGYYARARNLLKCARAVVQDHDGRFPDTEPGLRALPGIGPYTAAAIAAIAFDRPETVVDGNVERVMARLYAITDPLPGCKPVLKHHAAALTPCARPGDHAQAVMDLGATICTPRSPSCGVCPVRVQCRGHARGIAASLPARDVKPPKPIRHGIAYVGHRGGALVLERRPDRGLLGGMLGFPGSDWGDTPAEVPPFAADWMTLPGEVRHTFTHFHLVLAVRVAALPAGMVPSRGVLVPATDFRPSDLPTVMRKVFDLWRGDRPGEAAIRPASRP